MHATFEELRLAFEAARRDPTFWPEYVELMSTYSCRPTPLTFAENLTQHFGGAGAILQRNGGERHEARFAHRGLRQMGVDQARPPGALLGRQFIAEHIEPAANHLALDILVVHPFQTRG